MLKINRLYLTNAKENDIKLIMEMERHRENTNFVFKGTFEEHKAEIDNNDYLLLVVKEKETHEIVGFVLSYLDKKSERFEFRRFVISKKGMGYGKEVMSGILKFAFEELNMNRFWLDVYPDNVIGIRLYEGMGMHKDGVLRQNYKSERGYLDQIVYSMLKSEYYQLYSN